VQQQVDAGLASVGVSRPPACMSYELEFFMPKMKTKKSASKRFTARPNGSFKRGQAFKRHILTKKTTKNKRQLRGTQDVHETNLKSVRAMMPYA
jgi:large subunit ribosomal protein L35